MTLAFEISRLWTFEMLNNELWRWAALLGVLLASFIVGKVVTTLLERQARRLEAFAPLRALSVLLSSASKPAQLAIFAAGLYFAQTFLVLDVMEAEGRALIVGNGPIGTFWIRVAQAIGAMAVAWFLYRLVDVVEVFLQRVTAQARTPLGVQLVPLLRKTLRVFVVIVAALFIAQNIFEWKIGSVLAGLGIGGLAFALAAKDSLANLFGSVVIFADHAFNIGDRVVIKGYDGMVEEVGLRSTRIRTLTGNQVLIPNSVVATEPIENIGRRRTIRRLLNVTITYDTPPDKVRRGVEIIRELLAASSEHWPADQPPRVYFNEYNAESLNLIVLYWYGPPDWWAYMEFNHAFNLELLRRFNAEGIEFAFPTQTLYLRPEGEFAAAVRSSRPDPPGPRVGT